VPRHSRLAPSPHPPAAGCTAAPLPAARGFAEIGSDADIANSASHAAHRGWGFVETERVVYFRKVLGG